MPEAGNTPLRALRRVSSLILNSPGSEARKDTIINRAHGDRRLKSRDHEVIPDSEEERLKAENVCKASKENSQHTEVIEISSSDDDGEGGRLVVDKGKSKVLVEDDPFLDSIPGAWPKTKKLNDEPIGLLKSTGKVHNRAKNSQKFRSRRIFHDSSSENDDLVVIELTDSSPERPTPKIKQQPDSMTLVKTLESMSDTPSSSVLERAAPLYADEDEAWSDNGVTLTINKPKKKRKPLYLGTDSGASVVHCSGLSAPGLPSQKSSSASTDPLTHRGFSVTADPTPTGTPSSGHPAVKPSGSKSPTKAIRSTKTPREKSKAVLAAEKQDQLQAYADNLFVELNRVVFGNGLPEDTELKWSNTLRTTAGKAHWHRSRDGVDTCKIDMAVKILDSEERIRNTLSHEMCHLASWIISGDPNAGHGKIWKTWADRVMAKRPHIEVTTKHEYEISYKFNWECDNCTKVYGRHSKSIKPDQVVCGECEIGRLVPLFTIKRRAPRTPKTAAMVNAKPQGSPRSLPRLPFPSSGSSETSLSSCIPERYTLYDSDSDSDIEILTTTFGAVKISSCSVDD